jgi:hypothetical protein
MSPNQLHKTRICVGRHMSERRRQALSAAIGVITASRYEIDLPAVDPDERISGAELFEAVTVVAGWLARHTSEGDFLLTQIGQYVSQIDEGAA